MNSTRLRDELIATPLDPVLWYALADAVEEEGGNPSAFRHAGRVIAAGLPERLAKFVSRYDPQGHLGLFGAADLIRGAFLQLHNGNPFPLMWGSVDLGGGKWRFAVASILPDGKVAFDTSERRCRKRPDPMKVYDKETPEGVYRFFIAARTFAL